MNALCEYACVSLGDVGGLVFALGAFIWGAWLKRQNRALSTENKALKSQHPPSSSASTTAATLPTYFVPVAMPSIPPGAPAIPSFMAWPSSTTPSMEPPPAADELERTEPKG